MASWKITHLVKWCSDFNAHLARRLPSVPCFMTMEGPIKIVRVISPHRPIINPENGWPFRQNGWFNMVQYGSILFGWFNTSFNKNSKTRKYQKYPYFFIESWMCWIIFINSWGLGGCHQRQRARVPAGSGCGARSAATAGHRGAALGGRCFCSQFVHSTAMWNPWNVGGIDRYWSCDSGVSGDGYCYKIWDGSKLLDPVPTGCLR